MHLRGFGCKYFVHNNTKDGLRKFDPRNDEAMFLGYSSHNKAYNVFNKRTLCVEESVHVLFYETNSLVEYNALDEEYELGLTRRDLLLAQNSMHEKDKSPESKPSPRADPLEGGQGLNQTRGSIAEPRLEQNQPNSAQTDLRTGCRTGLETGCRTG